MDGKAEASDLTTHTSDTSNPHSVTKAQVGLGNADNTSDADKPVSTAQQTALDGKVDRASTASVLYGRNTANAEAAIPMTESAATPWTIPRRDSAGRVKVVSGAAAEDAVNKFQMDAADALKVNKAGDTMTGALTVDGGMSPIIIRGTGASAFLNVSMANDNANIGTQNINERRLIKNSSGTLRPALEQFSYLTTPTAGAERSTVRYFTFSDGAQIKVMKFNGPDVLVENQLSVGGARYIPGTGFPNGVVTAPTGSIYIDKAVTNGASSWIKKSGTGNTGWQVLEGDTGWRNITSLLTDGWTAVQVRIRRVNSTVHVGIEALNATASTAISFLSLPSGFQATSLAETYSARQFLTTATNPANVWRVTLQDNTVAIQGATTSLALTYGYLTFACDNQYPSTLPGTAI